MENAQLSPSLFTPEEEADYKAKLAGIIARSPGAETSAVYELFPDPEDVGKAFEAQNWLSDPFVIAEARRISMSQDAMPDQTQLAGEALAIARGENTKANVQLDALRLAGEFLGYITKGGVNINNNIDNRQCVLRLPPKVSKEEFARDFKAQQTKLIADARSSRPS